MPLKDPKKYKKYMREYYYKNLEKERESRRKSTRKYRLKYPERSRVSSARYKKENPDKIRAILNARRSRKTQAGGHFTTEQWADLCRAAGFRCLCCRKKKSLEADHVVPVSKGGTSWIENIQPLCGACNKRKRAKIIDYRVQ